MVVGILRLELELPGCFNLKQKRRVLNRIRDRVRQRFHAAVAETDRQDIWNAAEVGVAVVSNEQRHANEMLSHILAYVEANTEAQVIDATMEFWHG